LKIIIEQEELLGILKFVTEAADKEGSTVPILSHVIIDAKTDIVTFECTNAQQHALALCDSCDIDGTETITLPAKRFLSIVKQECGRITIEKTARNKKVSIKSSTARYKLDSLSPDEALPAPKVAGAHTTVAMSNLVTALACVAPSISNDDSRPALCGVFLHKSSKVHLQVIASDGRRLAQDHAKLRESGSFTKAILPAKAVAILCKHVPADGDGDIKIRQNKKHVAFVWPNRQLISVLIDQEFPNTDTIIKAERSQGITLPREAFAEALAKVSIMLDNNANCARLQIVEAATTADAKPMVHVLALNPFLGDAIVDIVSVELGKNTDAKQTIEHGVNPDYVLDILKVLSSDKVTINWSEGPESGLCIAENLFTGIIMPMRLSDGKKVKETTDGDTGKGTGRTADSSTDKGGSKPARGKGRTGAAKK